MNYFMNNYSIKQNTDLLYYCFTDFEKLNRVSGSLKVRAFYVALRKAVYLRVLPLLIANLSEEGNSKGHI